MAGTPTHSGTRSRSARYGALPVRACLLPAVLVLSACQAGLDVSQAAPAAKPSQPQDARRIVSLDYCADQYLLKLVDRDRILALSPDAQKPFSYMRNAAKGLAQVRPRAEDVLALKPDLVVRSYGGGPKAGELFRRAGVKVVDIGWTQDLAGVRHTLMETARALGEPQRGRAMLADFDARLAALKPRGGTRPTALYATSAGVTTGPGSLVHRMLEAAGYENYQHRPGWAPLPLENMVQRRPERMIAAFTGTVSETRFAWSAMRHPVAREALADVPTVRIDGAWTACGGWFVLDAIEAMAHEGDVHG